MKHFTINCPFIEKRIIPIVSFECRNPNKLKNLRKANALLKKEFVDSKKSAIVESFSTLLYFKTSKVKILTEKELKMLLKEKEELSVLFLKRKELLKFSNNIKNKELEIKHFKILRDKLSFKDEANKAIELEEYELEKMIIEEGKIIKVLRRGIRR